MTLWRQVIMFGVFKMALIEEALASLLKGRVQPKKGKVTYKPYSATSARLTAGLIAKKAPEVMVKITGFSYGTGGLKSHFEYIARTDDPNKDNVEIENERGQVFEGKQEVGEGYSAWVDDINSYPKAKRSREVVNLVLSMPAGTDPEKVKEAVRRFAKNAFSENHEYVFALHTDEDHPHVHLDIKMRGYNQVKLNPRKADLQNWREGFAEELRGLGVVAVASNRRARGITKKSVNSIVKQINSSDKSHKSSVAKTTALQTKEAVDELISEAKGSAARDKPWGKALEANLKDVKSQYAEVINLLMATNKKEDLQLAGELKSFLSGVLNKVVTQSDDLKRKALENVTGVKEAEKVKDAGLSR